MLRTLKESTVNQTWTWPLFAYNLAEKISHVNISNTESKMTHTTKKVQSIALELKRFEKITLQLEKHIEIKYEKCTHIQTLNIPLFIHTIIQNKRVENMFSVVLYLYICPNNQDRTFQVLDTHNYHVNIKYR